MEPVVGLYSKEILSLCEDGVVGFFIYGSVAESLASHKSDIDSMLITNSIMSGEQKAKLKRGAIYFQKKFGYLPDEVFPIEIFSLSECAKALELFGNAISSGEILDSEGDIVEICRSILSKKQIILGYDVVSSLESTLRANLNIHIANNSNTHKHICDRLGRPYDAL